MELLLDYSLLLDRGNVRERNEDRCGAFVPEEAPLLAERGYLFVVADGMGGHAAGDVAAEITLETVQRTYFQADWNGAAAKLHDALVAANDAILAAAHDGGRQGMGAAAVAVAVIGDRAAVGWLGDARVYLFRGTQVLHLTNDHSWVQERMDQGRLSEDEARHHPYRNVLTRALGAEPDAEPEVRELPLAPGDVILLCSDGLWGPAGDGDLAQAIAVTDTADQAAQNLVDLALARGGHDNISVIVVRATGGAATPSAPPPLAGT